MPEPETTPTGDHLPEVRDRSSARRVLHELTMFLPNFVILLKRLMTDPRVPTRSKMIVGGTALYLISPIDVVPDFVPGLGQLDDVVVAVLALHSLLNRVDEDVILEHWQGSEDLIRMVRAGVSAASRLLPGNWEKRV